uniref:Uncharacterized protein n=1 Tax=Takifugu rubripes TaxID=31033 RepID=A0A3B5KQ17_TAKRU
DLHCLRELQLCFGEVFQQGKLSKVGQNNETVSFPDPQVTTGQTISSWEQEGLCLYTLNRLHSFSILTARIFAVGNPAHHMDDSPQKCA